jgi:hypothetical protein
LAWFYRFFLTELELLLQEQPPIVAVGTSRVPLTVS